jgi:hypothetical protein
MELGAPLANCRIQVSQKMDALILVWGVWKYKSDTPWWFPMSSVQKKGKTVIPTCKHSELTKI